MKLWGVLILVGILIVVVGGYFWFQKDGVQPLNDTGITDSVQSVENNAENDDETSSNPTQIVEYQVSIRNFAFDSNELRIKAGERVVWTNFDSSRHTVTSTNGKELDSALLGMDQTYAYTFNEVGTYEYHCTPHPYMTGKIIVE